MSQSIMLAYSEVNVDIAASLPAFNVFLLCAAVEATKDPHQKWKIKLLFPLWFAHVVFMVVANWLETR